MITPSLYKTFPSILAGLALCASSLSALHAAVPQRDKLVLELTFDEAGEAGSKTLDASGQAADLRGEPGSGVDGRAFDNTGSSTMGGNNQHPGEGGQVKIANGSELLAGAKSFTLQGWYRTQEGEKPGNYARLLASARVSSYFDSAKGKGLVISVNRDHCLSPDGAYRLPGEWVFFAITYDGTKDSDNVCYYVGSARAEVRLVGRDSMAAGEVSTSGSSQAMIIGNVGSGDRPFDGLLDNFRLWVDKGGTGAVLSKSELEQVRKSDS